MKNDRVQWLAKLRQAYESGSLDEDTYRAAVAALGTWAAVEGSGAVAQGLSVAAGAGGVAVGGDVHGDVYAGPAPRDFEEALHIYRQVLASAYRRLPMRGIDVGASDPASGRQRLDLARVYVDLDTKTQVPLGEKDTFRGREKPTTRPMSALEAVINNRRLVVLGAPGSGKSTFLRHLAACLAARGLGTGADLRIQLPGWPKQEWHDVPVYILLRDFARCVPAGNRAGEPCHLWNFIVRCLQAQNLALAQEPLHRKLEEGSAVVLLDGLDEIPTQVQRTFVRDTVAAFAERYPSSRVVITCRTLSYQDQAWQMEDFPAFELASFDEQKIVAFIGAWYAELSRLGVVKAEDCYGLARQLQEAVRQPGLWRLGPNPLLLTVMALVHTHKGRLPDARALLYEDTVDILLWRWEQIKSGGEKDAPRLRQLLLEAERADVDLKRALWRLAFDLHRRGGARKILVDVSEWQLQEVLAGLHPRKSRDWAHSVIEAIRMRTGLLLECAPEVYAFPHLVFQEYLAGAHLSVQANFARQATRLVEGEGFWREAVLLAVGRLVYLSGDTDKPLALVGELCPEEAVNGDAAWEKTWLAGEALVEAGLKRVGQSALGRDLTERVRDRLADLLELGRLTSVERAAAGRTLARLGDPRPGVGVDPATGQPDILWCCVPPGPFVAGSSNDDEMAYGFEKPQYRNKSITEGYLISRYPITNAQFAAFVEAIGYQDRRYWTEVGWRWREHLGRLRPVRYDEPFNLPNHPVVGVTWFEAVAFCRWLQERLRMADCEWQIWRDGKLETWDLKPETLSIRLPSEAQWEKAARGTDGRRYPWGPDPNPGRANYVDTGIGATSAVGCFPSGASPYGVEDLSGNVLEWCVTKWEDDSKGGSRPRERRQVLRGGAFVSEARHVRCAFRCWSRPHIRGVNFGFRVVASPVRL